MMEKQSSRWKWTVWLLTDKMPMLGNESPRIVNVKHKPFRKSQETVTFLSPLMPHFLPAMPTSLLLLLVFNPQARSINISQLVWKLQFWLSLRKPLPECL